MKTVTKRKRQGGVNKMVYNPTSVTTAKRYMHVGEDHKRRAMREAAAKWQLNSVLTA